MRKITVEPAQLESCAARVDQENQDYMRDANGIFEAVEAMAAAWSGSDNLAFTNRISRYQADFRQISLLCTHYADFLRNSARAYRETQDSLTSQANSLV